ncbi:GGDEF domain-containing protein [Carnobacterium divergens]|uniref:GGDEF domain-containing protein n=1 Tax=Carnobacterium divergens TaxID=2748 RepID=UPI00288D5F2F|nr:GGDEF domain-containing protein [Carnobacterium divergens]MDT2011836.1 GGDEF domain-containing protein [Carnobacterium divergens]
MDAFLLVEPYITGIISILGIFFIEAFIVASFKLYIKQFLSQRTYRIVITLISGLIMTLFSIYFMMMSQKEDYYLIFGNLRMIIILIPIIFLNRNISLVSVILCSVFRLFYYGMTLVSLGYIAIFTSFFLLVVVIQLIVKQNQLLTFIYSLISASIFWIWIYLTNFDGYHSYYFFAVFSDYLNFVILSIIAYVSASYLYHLNNLLFQTMEESLTDELTKLRNLKDFNAKMNEGFFKAREKKEAFSLIIFDIDYFKAINDTYGHLAGDIVLKNLAKTIQEIDELKKVDVFRVGGEEFTIILSKKNGTETVGIAEKLRKKVELTNFYYENQLIHVTVSVGVTSLVKGLRSEITLNGFMELADEALYHSKHNGRNKVFSSDVLTGEFK